MARALKPVAAVTSEAEAQIVLDLLAGAGIQALLQRTIGSVEWGSSGARDVLVDEADLARAREVLAANEQAVSDDELARLSEQAGRESDGS
ncbi:MAG: putative signal transducing protein [Solirubrobacteraceae bacterium]